MGGLTGSLYIIGLVRSEGGGGARVTTRDRSGEDSKDCKLR